MAEIVLSEHTCPALVVKSGEVDGYEIPAGRALKIETSPGGDDLLNVTCPAGKVWNAHIRVELTESDA